MSLKSQDLLILLKQLCYDNTDWTYQQLAYDLGVSSSVVHNAVQRNIKAGLAIQYEYGVVPHYRNLEELLIHGVRYVFPAEYGQLTRGIPTAYAAPPLNQTIVPDDDPIPVWSHVDGEARGISFSPLHKAAPQAAMNDPLLYEWLALVDALRAGRARERELAAQTMHHRFESFHG